MNIAIFGAGAYGGALGEILRQNGHTIFFYDPFKFPDATVEDVLASSTVNILATPSNVAPKVLPSIPLDRPLICATKGFLTKRPFERYTDFSVLSGPAFADQLLAKTPTVLTATSPLVRDLFENTWLKIEQTSDIFGVLLCGSFKNIYAIGSGFRGLTPESPTFDDYITSACSELKAVLSINSCNPATVDLACGVGDLRLTCSSTDSRNYTFGQQLAQDPDLIRGLSAGSTSLDITTEGYSAVQSLTSSDLKLPDHTPILDEILNILKTQKG